MKYIVDLDALKECLACVSSIKVNGESYVNLDLIDEFIDKFPKDKVISAYTECDMPPPKLELKNLLQPE